MKLRSGGLVVGLSCVEPWQAGSNLALDFNFFSLHKFFLSIALPFFAFFDDEYLENIYIASK